MNIGGSKAHNKRNAVSIRYDMMFASIRAAAGFRDYQNLLDLNTDFLRCHKSYVVNLRYVEHWEMDGFTLTDGSVVNISRPYWQTARGVYACYMTQSRDEPHLERPQPAQLGGREAWR